MPDNIREQIAKRCVHYRNLFNNKTCNAGVNYDDVKVGKPYKFPCLQQGGECSQALFPTPEEVEAIVKTNAQQAADVLVMMDRVRQHYVRTQNATDEIGCTCGGKMAYSVSLANGHILASCPSCHMAFRE